MTTQQMTIHPPVSLLRTALKLDAVVTGANGLAYLAGIALLDSLLGPSPMILLAIGAFLTVFAIDVWWVGTRPTVSHRLVRGIVAVNAAWAIGSVLVALTGSLGLTVVGTVWAVLQALVVAGFAALQAIGLRRTT